MKTHLVRTSSLLRPNTLNYNAPRMASLASPARQLKTLAQYPELAISEASDDPAIRVKYRSFLLDPEVEAIDWISQLELETAAALAQEHIATTKSRPKVLVLYGSLRQR